MTGPLDAADLVPLNGSVPATGKARVTETALDLDSDLSAEEWEEIGHMLGRANRASAWWIGDWINYGEARWGEKYNEAERITGLAYKTLRNYASLCQQFELSRRRDNLSAQHHDAIRSLDSAKQEEVLNAAEEQDLTIHATRDLARRVSGRNRGRRVYSSRLHQEFVTASGTLVRLGERWEREMTDALTPPQARKQLTVLRKAHSLLVEVIEAVEYRADTLATFRR